MKYQKFHKLLATFKTLKELLLKTFFRSGEQIDEELHHKITGHRKVNFYEKIVLNNFFMNKTFKAQQIRDRH